MESTESVDVQQPVNEVRLNGGCFSSLPHDYEFPQAGVYDLWLKWNIRDTVRKIPPLKKLSPEDYKFLDSKPKPDGGKRRQSRKTYSDMKFVCECIEAAAKEIGMDPSDGSPGNIRLIYQQVWPTIWEGMRDGWNTQHKWLTLVDKLRDKKKKRIMHNLRLFDMSSKLLDKQLFVAALLLQFSILSLDFLAACRL